MRQLNYPHEPSKIGLVQEISLRAIFRLYETLRTGAGFRIFHCPGAVFFFTLDLALAGIFHRPAEEKRPAEDSISRLLSPAGRQAKSKRPFPLHFYVTRRTVKAQKRPAKVFYVNSGIKCHFVLADRFAMGLIKNFNGR